MRVLFILLLLVAGACAPVQEEKHDLKLWYKQPAQNWNEALPIGNGGLGAMIFGGVQTEQIQFNEETLWDGEPTDYSRKGAYKHLPTLRRLLAEGKQKQAEELAMKEFMSVPLRQRFYQAFGELYLDFPDHREYQNYYRELDIKNAIHRVSYQSNGVNYHREYLASHPDQLIAVKLTADQKNALNFNLRFDALHQEKSVVAEGNTMTLNIQVTDGALRGTARLKVFSDGQISVEGNQLKVSDAREASIYLSAATNYVKYNDVSGNPEQKTEQLLAPIAGDIFAQVKDRHIADYRKLFDRFELDFTTNERVELPTDERIYAFWQDPNDPQLVALYAQFGRYLLISSSRPGNHPANLQGIWNHELQPSWGSKYTLNINFEMNYWPAEITNLAECHEPFFGLIEDLQETGSIVAQEHYNMSGWLVHHNTDGWRGAAPINNANHGIWVTGGAWLCHHLWEHYLYSLDEEFLLNRAYPLMKGSAQFFTEFLVEDPKTGWLISTPSNSPEHGGLVAGPTMDHQIIRSLFEAVVQASKVLEIDYEFANQLSEMIPRIAPNQIGKHGQLQEWLEDKDDPKNVHRHVSHLWGVFPGKDINWEESPELMEAAIQSLRFRGDGGTGWSLAWKINFWTRFLDGNHTYTMIHQLLSPAEEPRRNTSGGSYPNLLDAHPPFQIDGNFGGTSGIVEMLIQSHMGKINLLPALPDALPNGRISGVRARGGFELSFSWENGQITEVEVLSTAGQPCEVVFGDKSARFDTRRGERYKLDQNLRLL